LTRSVVLGVDSSTQSTKVLALDVETGEVVAEGRAPHSGADIQAPEEWWDALRAAVAQVAAEDLRIVGMSVSGQQHGLVTLDAAGNVVRPAPLWNNVAAASDAERLNAEADFAKLVGTRLVASITIAKLAHLARTAPADLARTATVCLPHDWLNFMLTGNLATDRGEASGSGWWSPLTGSDRRDLLALAGTRRPRASSSRPCAGPTSRPVPSARGPRPSSVCPPASRSARGAATTWPPRSASAPRQAS